MTYYLIYLGMVFHLIDILFTYKYINSKRKEYLNPEELEINFHKFFMRTFGIEKGLIISSMISFLMILLVMTLFYFDNIFLFYFMLGMLFNVAYINVIQFLNEKDIKKRLIKNDRTR